MQAPDSAVAFMSGLVSRARASKKRIVFSEGSDARVLAAAERLARDGVARPILIGSAPVNACSGVTFIDPSTSELTAKYAALLYERRRAKGITLIEAAGIAQSPLYFAPLMVAAGDADGSVGGAVYTTAETVRAALHTVGTRPGIRVVSSAFIMALPKIEYGHNGLLVFADCAVVIDPSPVELAEIAIASADTTRRLLAVEPAVALLSFSTKGSGRHAQVNKTVEALKVIRQRAPGLNVDGELQADAALVAVVGQSKAPGSSVAGKANTLIFPNLAAANIGYKLVERLAGAAAIGPVLQGLAKAANDLSRGASAEDIFNTAVITAVSQP